MALTKFGINMIFGIVVAALGITAVTFSVLNSRQPEVQSQPTNAPSPDTRPQVDLANSVATLQGMAAREPQNPEYPTQIANLYYDAGEYGKAAEYYQRSLALRPDDPNVETDLASCFHYQGQDDKSLEILDRVLSKNPNFTQAKFNKGIVLVEGKKDVKGGIAVWEDLLRTDPAYAQKAGLEQRIQQLKASAR